MLLAMTLPGPPSSCWLAWLHAGRIRQRCHCLAWLSFQLVQYSSSFLLLAPSPLLRVLQILGGGVYALSPLTLPSKGLLSLLGYVDDAVFVACVAFYLNVLYRAVAPLGAARSAPARQAREEEPVATLDDSHLH